MCEQKDLADWVGISPASLSLALDRWGGDVSGMDIKDAVRWYCQRIRDTASGRGGMEDGEVFDLSIERAKTERLKQEKLRLDIAEQTGELVRAQTFHDQYAPMMDSFRANALGIPGKAVQAIRVLKGLEVDIEIIEDVVYEFLKTCAEYKLEEGEDEKSGVESVPETGVASSASGADDDDEMGDDV